VTPDPSLPSAVTVEAPLYAVDLAVIPALVAIVLAIVIVLLIRNRRTRQTNSTPGGA
jgi:hypothetical protein